MAPHVDATQLIPGEIVIYQTYLLSDLGELGKLTRSHPAVAPHVDATATHARGRERVLQSLFLGSRNLTYLAFITFAIEQRKLFLFTFP